MYLRDTTVLTTARSWPTNGQSSDFIQADVANGVGVAHVVKVAIERLVRLDILSNSVGGFTAPGDGALALTNDHWQLTLELDLLSAIRLDRGFLVFVAALHNLQRRDLYPATVPAKPIVLVRLAPN